MSAMALVAAGANSIIQGAQNVKSYDVSLSRNEMARVALDGGYDYLLWLDSDMTFPHDTLIRLLEHQKEVVCARYLRRVPPHVVLGVPEVPDQLPIGHGLQRMKRVPTGVLLVHRSVFERLPFPWFRLVCEVPGHGLLPNTMGDDDNRMKAMTEDYWFSDRVAEAGIEMWADLDLSREVGHIGHQTVQWNPETGEPGT